MTVEVYLIVGFCSYLNKGRQTIKESLYDSQNEVSSFGVLQGSVLGLLSFLIYR